MNCFLFFRRRKKAREPEQLGQEGRQHFVIQMRKMKMMQTMNKIIQMGQHDVEKEEKDVR